MDAPFWANLAFGIIVFFFFMYSLLDGFDLGIGILAPLVRDKKEADRLVGLISPFWDGNEVWLVMAAGFLFAAFPAVFASLVSAFYLPFMAVIAAFILRAASLEFSYHDGPRLKFWRGLLGAASFVAAFAGLLAVGCVLQGLPLNSAGEITGLRNCFGAFPLVFALAGLGAVVWHGLAYGLGKDPSPGMRGIVAPLWSLTLGASLALAGLWAALPPPALHRPLVCAGGGIYAAGLILGRVFLSKPGWTFRCSGFSVLGLWLAVGATLFPNALPARNHPEWSLALAQAAAPLSSLRPLCVLCLVLIPLILSYTIFIYHIFRSKDKIHETTAHM